MKSRLSSDRRPNDSLSLFRDRETRQPGSSAASESPELVGQKVPPGEHTEIERTLVLSRTRQRIVAIQGIVGELEVGSAHGLD